MLKKIKIPKIIICLCLALILGTLISMRVPCQAEEPMQAFPSYDWSTGDVAALAAISANTPGDDHHKQEAMFAVLNYVWYNNTGNLSLIEYVECNYELYNEVIDYDYELVTMLEL